MTEKSILDNFEVKTTQGFHDLLEVIRPVTHKEKPIRHQGMVVAGSCPSCGNPVYGHKMLTTDGPPEILRTCNCFDKSDFQSKIQTK